MILSIHKSSIQNEKQIKKEEATRGKESTFFTNISHLHSFTTYSEAVEAENVSVSYLTNPQPSAPYECTVFEIVKVKLLDLSYVNFTAYFGAAHKNAFKLTNPLHS